MAVVEDAQRALHPLPSAERPIPLPAEGRHVRVGAVLVHGIVRAEPELPAALAGPAVPLLQHPVDTARGGTRLHLALERLLAAVDRVVRRVDAVAEVILTDEAGPLLVPGPPSAPAAGG